ncbi:MAG: ROK family protein [Rhodoferax sp.]|nr:ROK family protein [Rhodoferax sp.]
MSHVAQDAQVALAVDVGGTKILAAAVDANGCVLAQTRVATPAREGATAVLGAMRDALHATMKALAVDSPWLGLGISAAGIIDRDTARVIDATDALPGWKGTDFRAAFADLGLPVQAINDVHAALMGESAWGALAPTEGDKDAVPVQHAAMLAIGTGLGGALLANGKLFTGAQGLAGHFGRTQLQWQGQWLPTETLVSGSGLAYLYTALGGTLPPQAGAREVLAQDDAPRVQAALAEWSCQLAHVIANLHWAYNPEVLLLGGGMMDARQHWHLQVLQALQDMGLAPNLVFAELGTLAGVCGAAQQIFAAAGVPVRKGSL